MLEDRTAKYAVEVFKYLRELPYDVSTKVITNQLDPFSPIKFDPVAP